MGKLKLSWVFVAGCVAKQERLSFPNIGQVYCGWGLGLKRFFSYRCPTWFNKELDNTAWRASLPIPLIKMLLMTVLYLALLILCVEQVSLTESDPRSYFFKKVPPRKGMCIIWVSNMPYKAMGKWYFKNYQIWISFGCKCFLLALNWPGCIADRVTSKIHWKVPIKHALHAK